MPRKKPVPVEEPEQVQAETVEETPKAARRSRAKAKPEEQATAPDAEASPIESPPVEDATGGGEGPDTDVMEVDLSTPVEPPPRAETPQPIFNRRDPPVSVPKGERQQFFGMDFNELDRDLTTAEQQEWNSIYASYRGRSALSGTVIGVDAHSISIKNPETNQVEQHTMYCAIVVPYRVRVVIPATEMWEPGQERPNFVLQNSVGATIDFIIIKVDRENGFAIGSRRLALRAQQHFYAHRPALRQIGARLTCRVISVGPRRCLVECNGYDINLTQRELRYTAIPDLRDEYHPGQELECVVKGFDLADGRLKISVKETQANPFDGAELRHPVGCRRQAVIAGKYGGGVFCNLPDGTVCLCNYAYQHEDGDFKVGDTVIIVIQKFENHRKQMYGKILYKW